MRILSERQWLIHRELWINIGRAQAEIAALRAVRHDEYLAEADTVFASIPERVRGTHGGVWSGLAPIPQHVGQPPWSSL